MQLYACRVEEAGKNAEHETAYRLLWHALSNAYGLSPSTIRRDSHGKPFFPDAPEIHFNLSHCDGMAVCGIGNASLGVDVEKIRQVRPRVLQRAFCAEETNAVTQSDAPEEWFFRYWTLKESYVKAIGIGISYPLNTVCFHWNGSKIYSNVTGWQFQQYRLTPHWIISCCTPDDTAVPTEVLYLPEL